MPIGRIYAFDSGKINGTLSHLTYTKPVTIGGNGNNSATYSMTVDEGVHRSLMVIKTIREKPAIPRWRLWINDFSLTREFKPSSELEYRGCLYSSLIYDITPIVKRGKNNIVISYAGSDNITIDQVGFVNVYRVEGFETEYILMGGELLLEPGEEVELEGAKKFYAVIRNFNKNTKVVLVSNNSKIWESTGGEEGEEIELSDCSRFSVRHLQDSQGKAKPIMISLVYLENMRAPKIDLVVNSKRTENGYDITLQNSSELGLDNVIVTLLVGGVPVFFKKINALPRGNKEYVEVPARLDSRNRGEAVLRVIGVKGSYQVVKEVKL